MYLSKVDIFGFKSFAQKTSLKFNEGMSCIIGPNGSGKSNIVDSIRWVLGEQKLATLRTDRMENVIFNGTNSRKQLGMAEVSLTIQNNKNILKSQFTEVVISRRLYRSGESHYLMNKSLCRLKDITDLFMDTGMGANSYSVIELGMVENIISENASERRHLFEEAAGINKYKNRRKSAIRKLDATVVDMSRISDLISEIQRTVNSLSRQVGKARRYLRFKDELQTIEVDLARYRFTRLMDEIHPLQKQLNEISMIKEDTSHQITLEEALLEEYKREIIHFEENLTKYNKQLSEQDDKIYQLKEEEAVAQARLQGLDETVRRNTADITEFKQKIKNLDKNIEDFVQKETALAKEVDKLDNIHKKHEKEYDAARANTNDNKNLLQSLNDNYKNLSNEFLSIKEKMQEKDIRKQSSTENISQLKSENAETTERQRQLDSEITETAANRNSLEDKRRKLEHEINQSGDKRNHLIVSIDELNEKRQKLLGQKEAAESRYQLFETMISGYEGHSQGTMYVMEHQSDFKGIRGPISDLVDVNDEFKIAVETVLGDTVNYIVVDTTETARQIINTLKTENSGRVTLLPMDLLQKIELADRDSDDQNEHLLIRNIQCDKQYEKIFKILLGDVVVVDSLDDAINGKSLSSDHRYVSRNGELLHHAHAISGGQKTSTETSVIGRKEKLKEVEDTINSLAKEIEKLDSSLQASENDKNVLINAIDNLLNDKSALDSQILDIDRILSQKEYELSTLKSLLDTKNKQLAYEQSLIEEMNRDRAALQKEADQKQV